MRLCLRCRNNEDEAGWYPCGRAILPSAQIGTPSAHGGLTRLGETGGIARVKRTAPGTSRSRALQQRHRVLELTFTRQRKLGAAPARTLRESDKRSHCKAVTL
jgi:hypothetical protein